MVYNFNQYSNKSQARQDTIIDMYRSLFKKNSIPKFQDYITLCANQVEGDELENGSELKQLINSNFISLNQFYGVDIDKSTIEINKAVGGANWVYSDLLSFLIDNMDKLNPALINIDSVFYDKRKITELLSDVLLLISENYNSDCMVVSNFVLNNPYLCSNINSDKMKEVIEKEVKEYQTNLLSNRFYRDTVKVGWKQYHKHYVYSSTGKACMATFVYYRYMINDQVL